LPLEELPVKVRRRQAKHLSERLTHQHKKATLAGYYFKDDLQLFEGELRS
jgi:hypothetical protein